MKAKERIKSASKQVDKLMLDVGDAYSKAMAEAILECFVKADEFDLEDFLHEITMRCGEKYCKEFKAGFWFGSMFGRLMSEALNGTDRGQLTEKMIDLGIEAKESSAAFRSAEQKKKKPSKFCSVSELFENK